MKTMSKNVETENKGMLMSHAQRLSQPHKSYPKTFCQDYDARGTEEVVVNGRVIKKSVIKIVHPQDKFKGITVNDFALENVIAVGALDSLKEGYLSANSLSELSDSIEGTIDNVINAVNDAESSATQNDGGNE